jgi:gluconokinase
MTNIVVMGVAGCGKSSLGRAIAAALDWAYVEGDAHHSPASIAKMRAGSPLTDADRSAWLTVLGAQLAASSQMVLACSALKRSYRDQLRAASPGLRFVFIDISRELALQRVAARGDADLFPVRLVDSQFATLEAPVHEAFVLRVDAALPPEQQLSQSLNWLNGDNPDAC